MIRSPIAYLLIALAMLLGACTATPLTWSLPDGVKTAQVNGYPLAYLESGSGPTTVAIHGAMNDYRSFEPVRAAMATQGRFVSISVRHSYPEPYDGSKMPRTIAQNARDVIAVIENLGPPVNLIGHSMGGDIAAHVARMRPELIRKLVLAEGATTALTPDSPIRAIIERSSRGIEAELQKGNRENAAVHFFTAAGWARLPAAQKTAVNGNLWPFVHYGRDETTPPVTCRDLASLRMPVMLVIGENTSSSFKTLVAEQQKCLPTARLARIEKAGHSMQRDNPAGFATVVQEFLR